MNESLIGKVIADKYRIESYLGESRSGSLYLAKHLLIGSTVTVKVLERSEDFEESQAARFSAEARAVSKIAHPNILNITDFGQDADGTIFSVMEDASGETLRTRIDREGQIGLGTAIRITRQIAAALSAAHAKGLAHGSLTPSKVVLAKIGGGAELVKVFDVGAISLKAEPEQGSPRAELTYSAPELFDKEPKANAKSDVYSLGIVLYELLAGEPPFSAETTEELAQKHRQVPPPPLVAYRNDLPDGLELVILKALAKDPDKRYADVPELISALNEAADEEAPVDALIIPMDSADQSNNIWKTAFIVLAGVSILSLGLIYWSQNREAMPAESTKTDANAQPVQPLNPATGIAEQNSLANAQETLASDQDKITKEAGGDEFDPWANPGGPPSGQTKPIGPGGEYVTVPGGGSVFMPADGGVILVPKVVPKKSPDGTASPGPTPETEAGGNSNTQSKPKTTPSPAKNQNTAPAKPTPEAKPSGAEKKKGDNGVTRDA